MKIPRVALMWHGDREDRNNVSLPASRFALAADCLKEAGIIPVGVIYNDDFLDEVEVQLRSVDAVQVWVNPVVDGRDRSQLDSMLRRLSESGVLVYTHPDLILKMGTKQVLYDTRNTSLGSNVSVHHSIAEMKAALATELGDGKARVMKQYRGHSGGGIWKIQSNEGQTVGDDTLVRIRHAQRGSIEDLTTFAKAMSSMEIYFHGDGRMVIQEYQERLPEGITRIYLVGDQVGGFGHQAINALYPSATDEPPEATPLPGPRLYHPPDAPTFQRLKKLAESGWIDEICGCLGLNRDELPLLWDMDLFLGPKDSGREDSYVLCEINVSCVSPYPEWANPLLAQTLKKRIEARKD